MWHVFIFDAHFLFYSNIRQINTLFNPILGSSAYRIVSYRLESVQDKDVHCFDQLGIHDRISAG